MFDGKITHDSKEKVRKRICRITIHSNAYIYMFDINFAKNSSFDLELPHRWIFFF